MPGATADDLPSTGFLARYLADAAKQRMPARSVGNVLRTYVDRGLSAEQIAQAFATAQASLGEGLRPLLTEYADGIGDGATTGTSPAS